MAGNKAVVYKGPGLVAVENIPYPTLEVADGPGVNPANVGRACSHGVILKVVSTNICGSDQHMVRGRTMCWSLPQILVETTLRMTPWGHARPTLAGFTPGPSATSRVG